MGIRVSHADVGTYARLGQLAGQATAAREAAARQDAINRQMMQIQAQTAAQERQLAHQKEMAEFDAYLDMHKYQAASQTRSYVSKSTNAGTKTATRVRR